MSEIPSGASQPPNTAREKASTGARSSARSSVFRYYIHDSIGSCRLQLLGELTEAQIPDLNGCWRTAKTSLGQRNLILDLHALRSVDEAGKQWLASMAQEGATCTPESYLRDLVAGRHTAGIDPAKPAAKPGLLSRLLSLARGIGVEAAK